MINWGEINPKLHVFCCFSVMKQTSTQRLNNHHARFSTAETRCNFHSVFVCLQVWNVARAMLLRVFDVEHEEQVNHCEFTNTSRRLLLATCSNDKCLNLKVCVFMPVSFLTCLNVFFYIYRQEKSYCANLSKVTD